MPEYPSPTQELMDFILKGLPDKITEIFDDMTDPVWACAKNVDLVLVDMAGKYQMTRQDVLNLKYTFQLIDVVHEQECEDNMQREIRQRNHRTKYQISLLKERLDVWNKAKEVFRVNPKDPFIEALIRDGGGDYLSIIQCTVEQFDEQADMEIAEINGFIKDLERTL